MTKKRLGITRMMSGGVVAAAAAAAAIGIRLSGLRLL